MKYSFRRKSTAFIRENLDNKFILLIKELSFPYYSHLYPIFYICCFPQTIFSVVFYHFYLLERQRDSQRRGAPTHWPTPKCPQLSEPQVGTHPGTACKRQAPPGSSGSAQQEAGFRRGGGQQPGLSAGGQGCLCCQNKHSPFTQTIKMLLPIYVSSQLFGRFLNLKNERKSF